MIGCLKNILVGSVLVILLALLLDTLTLLYEYWWVLALIVLAVCLFFVFRKGWRMDGKKTVGLNRLIKAAACDGLITAKERNALIQNRINAGMDPVEAEIIVDARLTKLKVKVEKNI